MSRKLDQGAVRQFVRDRLPELHRAAAARRDQEWIDAFEAEIAALVVSWPVQDAEEFRQIARQELRWGMTEIRLQGRDMPHYYLHPPDRGLIASEWELRFVLMMVLGLIGFALLLLIVILV